MEERMNTNQYKEVSKVVDRPCRESAKKKKRRNRINDGVMLTDPDERCTLDVLNFALQYFLMCSCQKH